MSSYFDRASGGPPLNEFVEWLQQSQLIEPEFLLGEFRDFRDSIPNDGLANEGRALAFGRYLVGKGLLTEWQCERLLEGKYRGFVYQNLVMQEHVRNTYATREYIAIDRSSGRRVLVAVCLSPSRKLSIEVVKVL
jgi:hypothetical protein